MPSQKIQESQKDCTKVMGNGGPCEVSVSSCYHRSTREGGNGRKIDLCGDRRGALEDFITFYKPLS